MGKVGEEEAATTFASEDEPPPKLVDLQWTLGVTASSSERAVQGNTFVQLRLQTREDQTPTIQNVHAEMTPKQFYILLQNLKVAHSKLSV